MTDMNPDDIEAIAAYARNIAGSSGIDGNAGARRALLKAYLSIGGDELAEHLIIIDASDPADLSAAYDEMASEADTAAAEAVWRDHEADREESLHIATHRHFGGKL